MSSSTPHSSNQSRAWKSPGLPSAGQLKQEVVSGQWRVKPNKLTNPGRFSNKECSLVFESISEQMWHPTFKYTPQTPPMFSLPPPARAPSPATCCEEKVQVVGSLSYSCIMPSCPTTGGGGNLTISQSETHHCWQTHSLIPIFVSSINLDQAAAPSNRNCPPPCICPAAPWD